MLYNKVTLLFFVGSKNRGGIETAHFLSKLLLQAPQLVDVNAANNSMPIESLPIISSALKLAQGIYRAPVRLLY